MKNEHFKTLIRNFRLLNLIAIFTLGTSTVALAEANKVRLAQQFGLQNLPVQVMVGKKLIEKHAKKKGLGDIKVTMAKLGGGAAVNDALLSGSVDFAAGGTGPHLKIWDKSRGNLDVRAISAMVSLPMLLNTNQPHIKSLKDITEKDRIAVPAIRVSINAVVLQMAGKKLYGDPGRFDPWTVSMKHPDARVALLGGKSIITLHFTVPPFSYSELTDPKIHTVATSYEILGGRHTQFSLYNTRRFRDENPKLFRAVYDALVEAVDIINKDKRAAAEFYVQFTKSKLKTDFVEEMVRKPEVVYTTTPENVMKFAEFLYSIKSINNMPSSWKDLYWEPIHDQPGS